MKKRKISNLVDTLKKLRLAEKSDQQRVYHRYFQRCSG